MQLNSSFLQKPAGCESQGRPLARNTENRAQACLSPSFLSGELLFILQDPIQESQPLKVLPSTRGDVSVCHVSFFFNGCAGSSLLRGLFLVAASRDVPLVVVHRLLIVVVSLVAKRGLSGTQASEVAVPRLWSSGSIVVTHGLSCSVACRVHPRPGIEPMLLHWQADSLPLSHLGSPALYLNTCTNLFCICYHIY